MNFPIIVDRMEDVVEWIKANGEAPAVVNNFKLFYMYGHVQEISNRLLEMDESKRLKYKKYPLVALRLDTPETVADGMVHFKLNIAILDRTEEDYDTPKRYEKVFKPVLYPIFQDFVVGLRECGFSWESDTEFPPCTKIDRPYWGTANKSGNEAFPFNDPLDAIELLDLKINLPTC